MRRFSITESCGRLLANEVNATDAESKAGDHVHDVMLVGEDGRESDQNKPGIRGRAQNSASMPVIVLSQDRSESDVERWKQVVGLIHLAKPIEDCAEPAARERAFEGETKRKQEKADSRDDDRGDDAFGKSGQFPLTAAEERRGDKEEIDRQVGHDHQRHERDEAFPFEEERADVVALRGDPIAPAVNDEKENRKAYGCSEGLQVDRALRARCVSYRLRRHY